MSKKVSQTIRKQVLERLDLEASRSDKVIDKYGDLIQKLLSFGWKIETLNENQKRDLKAPNMDGQSNFSS